MHQYWIRYPSQQGSTYSNPKRLWVSQSVTDMRSIWTDLGPIKSQSAWVLRNHSQHCSSCSSSAGELGTHAPGDDDDDHQHNDGDTHPSLAVRGLHIVLAHHHIVGLGVEHIFTFQRNSHFQKNLVIFKNRKQQVQSASLKAPAPPLCNEQRSKLPLSWSAKISWSARSTTIS